MLNPIDLASITETLVFAPNEDLLFSFNLYENGGINNIEHIGLYFNNSGHGLKVNNYDTSIVFDRYPSEKTVLSDPNGLIESYKFKIREVDAYNFKITYTLTFSQPIDPTNFYITVWDSSNNANYKTFEDVLQISNAEILPDKTFEDITLIDTEPSSDDLFDDITKIIPEVMADTNFGIGGKLNTENFDGIKITGTEKEEEIITTPKTVCEDGTILQNKICVVDTMKQESTKSNTISIIIIIFIMEIILGFFLAIIFRRRRKHQPSYSSLNFIKK